MINKIIHSATKFACFGVAMNVLVPYGLAFLLPNYETHYPSASLYNYWKKEKGAVFQRAFERIYKEMTTNGKVYKHNDDDAEKQNTLGCFNTYFGTSLWRSRINLTHELKYWLPASGTDQGGSYGNWKQFPLPEKDLGRRLPQIFCIQTQCGKRRRQMELVSDLDWMLKFFSWGIDVSNKFAQVDREDTMQYVKDCLCVVMSEEFSREILTNQTMDLLLKEQDEVRRKKMEGKSDGRELTMEYAIEWKWFYEKQKNGGKEPVFGFEIVMHLYDVHQSPTEVASKYEGEAGNIFVPSIDYGNTVSCKKNLNIQLRFLFDVKHKTLRSVGLEDSFIVNASLITRVTGKNNLYRLFLSGKSGKTVNCSDAYGQ